MASIIDAQTDVPLTAIAALVRGAIEADLGAQALKAVYAEPRPPHDLDEAELPTLAIFRTRDRWRRRNSASRINAITVTFEYTLPGANVREERALRWPTLQAVWGSLVGAVVNGHHIAVADDAAVLNAAGVFVLQESPDARYELAAGGREGDAEQNPRRPFFRGVIDIEYEPSGVDPLTLDKFLSLHASYDIVQTAETADTPSQPGVSTDEGPVETDLEDFEIADILPGADED